MTSAGWGLASAKTLFAGTAFADCNGKSGPCRIADGTYHIVLPSGAKGPLPATRLLRGWSTAYEGTIRNRGVVDLMFACGYPVIAKDGLPRSCAKLAMEWFDQN
jgi:polyhydroxybutyrate depolymerase